MVHVEINAENILHNIFQIKQKIGTVKLCCVLKGDAYGCGALDIARLVEAQAPVDMLAVATVSEGRSLRTGGIKLPILVLSDTADEDIAALVQADLIATVSRPGFLEKLEEAAKVQEKSVIVHVRLDVCAGSPGIEPQEFLTLTDSLKKCSHIKWTGVYTQLYGAYMNKSGLLQEQIEVFSMLVKQIPFTFRKQLCVHAASTAAAYMLPEAHFDMVRIGAGIYGLPYDEIFQQNELRSVMTIKSHIIDIKRVRGSAFGGYSRTADCDGFCRLAVVEGGYEDIALLFWQEDAEVLVRGQRVKVESVSMDSCIIDVSALSEASPGDEVVFLGCQNGDSISVSEVIERTPLTLSNCQVVQKTGARVERHLTHLPETTPVQRLMIQMKHHCPTLKQVLDEDGDRSLTAYVQRLADFEQQVPLCNPEDVVQEAEAQLLPLLGVQVAKEAASGLIDCALTANHHGVDYFASAVQGNLLFQYLLEKRGFVHKHIPVIACGLVSMCNSSFGQGMTLYELRDGALPQRFPIVKKKYKNSCVGMFPAMTAEMIDCAKENFEKKELAAQLSEPMQHTVRHILNDIYKRPDVLACERYVDQACLINHALSMEATGCGVAYVNAEELTTALFLRDMDNKESLSRRLLVDSEFRQAVFSYLDGVSGCWSRKGDRLTGSMLFWGEDQTLYRRAPLYDDGDALVNRCTGERFSYSAVPDALAQGRLYPGIFLHLLKLLFERGLRCFGGYFQPHYLRDMQRGLCQALNACGDETLAKFMETRVTDGYLSGPVFLSNGHGTPYGSVELLAHKDELDIQQAMACSMREAHENGLLTLYRDIVPVAERLPDHWVQRWLSCMER